MKKTIKGLWVPLLTPLNEGHFDEISTLNLLKSLEPHVDGFVPCLSSGEGSKMKEELWEKVVGFVMQNTGKPVAVGILKDNPKEIIALAFRAKNLGCFAIVVPVMGISDKEKEEFCKKISEESPLPVIIYNSESSPITNINTLKEVANYQNIIAIKDSSGNQAFFDEMLNMKRLGSLEISILQGMENQLLQSAGCDGYLIALANAEPELCKNMFYSPSEELNKKIMAKWDEYNLSSKEWYLNLKKVLHSKKLLKSFETL